MGQGDIESVAAMHPKELTKMFEHVSGSVRLAKEYARLVTEKEKAEGVMAQLHGRKKNLLAEERQKKGQMAEAELHQQNEQALKDARLTLCAWKVYVCEQARLTGVSPRKRMTVLRRVGRSVNAPSAMRRRKGSAGGEAEASSVGETCARETRKRGAAHDARDAARSANRGAAQSGRRLQSRMDPVIRRAKTTGEKKTNERKEASRKPQTPPRLDAPRQVPPSDFCCGAIKVTCRKLKGDLEELESARRRFEEVVAREEGQGVRLSDKDLETYHEIKNRIVSSTGKLQQEKSALDLTQATSVDAQSRLQSSMDHLRSQIDAWTQALEVLEGKRTATAQEMQEVHEKTQEAQCEKHQLAEKAKQGAARRDALILAVRTRTDLKGRSKGAAVERKIAKGDCGREGVA